MTNPKPRYFARQKGGGGTFGLNVRDVIYERPLSPDHLKFKCYRSVNFQRPYVCNICPDKGFAGLKPYREHMNVHSGEKPNKCKFCDARFSHTSNMYAHLKICKKDDKAKPKVEPSTPKTKKRLSKPTPNSTPEPEAKAKKKKKQINAPAVLV